MVILTNFFLSFPEFGSNRRQEVWLLSSQQNFFLSQPNTKRLDVTQMPRIVYYPNQILVRTIKVLIIQLISFQRNFCYFAKIFVEST